MEVRAPAAHRGDPGGIAGLGRLIREHRGALEYDFRSRFHLGVDQIGEEVGYREAIRLIEHLAADTGTWLCASLNGWSHPITAETIVAADLFDAVRGLLGGKRAMRGGPHPIRPWTTRKREHWGDVAGRTREQVQQILIAARQGAYA